MTDDQQYFQGQQIIIKPITIDSKKSNMDPNDFIQNADFSQSMLESSQSTKQSKQHSSFTKNKNKSGAYDSFSFQNDTESLGNVTRKTSEIDTSIQSQKSIGKENNSRLMELFELQEQLQKEYLMLVKQQSQKSKFKKQIQQQMKSYYSLFIQSRSHSKKHQSVQQPHPSKPHNKLVSDDGFDNCYNFIKQVIVTLSKNFPVGIVLLLNCTISNDPKEKGSVYVEDYEMLVELVVNVLYERVTETDPFLKDVTKMMAVLMGRLVRYEDEERDVLLKLEKQNQKSQNNKLKPSIRTNYDKILYIFDKFMQKQQMSDYFQILSNSMLKKIQKVSYHRAVNRNRVGISLHQSKSILIDPQNSMDIQKFIDPSSSFGFNLEQNWLQYIKPQQSFNDQKRALAMNFISHIFNQADLCPISLKIVLKYYYEHLTTDIQVKYPTKLKSQIKLLCSLKLWLLIEEHYLEKLQVHRNQNMLMKQMTAGELEILGDVVRMVRGFFGGQKKKVYERDEELVELYRKARRFIVKVVEKLIAFSEEKYGRFKQEIDKAMDMASKVQVKQTKSMVQPIKKQAIKDHDTQSSSSLVLSRTSSKQQNASTLPPSSQQQSITIDTTQHHNPIQIHLSQQLVKIYGGCISFKQIQTLLSSLRRMLASIPNDRITNRVQRIFDMSPNLQFLSHHKQVNTVADLPHLFVVLLEIEFDELINNDYKVLYVKEYQQDKVKNMIRQVVCELKLREVAKVVNRRELVRKKKVNVFEYELEDLKMMKKKKELSPTKGNSVHVQTNAPLTSLLQKISTQCSKSLQGTQTQLTIQKGISLQLLKKIKYLLYLFQGRSQLNQTQILKEMLQQTTERRQKMMKIYEHTKFGLLAAVGNVRHYRNLLVARKDIEEKVWARVRSIRVLEELGLSVCLTSPWSRSNPEHGFRAESPSKLSTHSSTQSPLMKPQPQPSLKSSLTSNSFSKRKPSLTSQPQSPLLPSSQTFNKYKYRISNADDIVICQTQECIHKDNMFMGLGYHVTSVGEFVGMFAGLREVAENVFWAGFIIDQGTCARVEKELAGELRHCEVVNHPLAGMFMSRKYNKLNYSISKINLTLYQFMQYLYQSITSTKPQPSKHSQNQLKKLITTIILRGLHQKLVQRSQQYIKINNIIETSHRSLKRRNERMLQEHGLEAKVGNEGVGEGWGEIDGEDVEGELEKEQGQVKGRQGRSENIMLHGLNGSSRGQCRGNKQQKNSAQVIKVPHNLTKPSQSPTFPSCFTSRNDQILLYRTQKLHSSSLFQSYYHTLSLCSQKSQNNHEQKQSTTSMKQLEEVCARYISKINKKETPEEKIELMKSVMDVYRLVVKDTEGGKEYKAKQHSEKVSNLEMLIFRAIVIAEPPNFITNLAFIEMFLHKDKLLSIQGKILNQYKKITKHIYQNNLQHYLGPQLNSQSNNQNQQIKWLVSRIKNSSIKE